MVGQMKDHDNIYGVYEVDVTVTGKIRVTASGSELAWEIVDARAGAKGVMGFLEELINHPSANIECGGVELVERIDYADL